MLRQFDIGTLTRLDAWLVAAVVFALSPAAASAQSGDPIKIGYGISQTGGLAPNGKSALLAQRIWEDDVNAKGGLLGHPVKLVYYDDQSNPSTRSTSSSAGMAPACCPAEGLNRGEWSRGALVCIPFAVFGKRLIARALTVNMSTGKARSVS